MPTMGLGHDWFAETASTGSAGRTRFFDISKFEDDRQVRRNDDLDVVGVIVAFINSV